MSGRVISRLRRLAWVPIVFAVASCDLNDVSGSEAAELMPQSKDKRPVHQAKLDSKLQSLVDVAQADLIQRLEQQQLDAQKIMVLRAERVTWRSGALGCPKPDRAYKMVLVPGVLIQLRAGRTSYEYHSTLLGPPFLCEPPRRIETPAPGNNSFDLT